MISTEILTSLLSDPDLRGQVSRLLSNKVRADVKSLEASSLLSRQLLESAIRSQQGQPPPNGMRLRRLIKEHLNFYESIIQQTLNFNQRLIEELHSFGIPPAAENSVPTMRLTAPLHSTVRTPFVLDNNRATAISVGFEITPFVTESGNTFVSTDVAFDPPGLELKPGQEGKVELIIAVTRGFEPGQVYFATITVKGLNGTQMLVRLQVEPEQAEAATRVHTAERVDEAAPAAPKAKRAGSAARAPRKAKAAAAAKPDTAPKRRAPKPKAKPEGGGDGSP